MSQQPGSRESSGVPINPAVVEGQIIGGVILTLSLLFVKILSLRSEMLFFHIDNKRESARRGTLPLKIGKRIAGGRGSLV
jgi:hypothetical protein